MIFGLRITPEKAFHVLPLGHEDEESQLALLQWACAAGTVQKVALFEHVDLWCDADGLANCQSHNAIGSALAGVRVLGPVVLLSHDGQGGLASLPRSFVVQFGEWTQRGFPRPQTPASE